MTKKFAFVIGMFFLITSSVFSQSNTNKWENFTDLKNVRAIAVKGNNYIAATSGGLFFYNSGNEQYRKFTNLNGLVNIDLTSLIIDTQSKIWIGASDGSIVLMDLNGNVTKTIYDIKNSAESNKSINCFYQYGNSMYVGTGYGIQRIDVNTQNFVDAPYYQLGVIPIKTPVTAITVNRDTIFVGTKSGMGIAKIPGNNLNSPSSWINNFAFPLNANINTVESFDGNVFAGSEIGLAYYTEGTWSYYPNSVVANGKTIHIKGISNKLYFITNGTVYSAPAGNIQNISIEVAQGTWSYIQSDDSQTPVYGSNNNGIFIKSGTSYAFKSPNSPFTSVFDYMTIDETGNLWVAGGSGLAGIYKYDGTTWTNINNTLYPALGNSNNFRRINHLGNTVFALSFGGGVSVIKGDYIKNYNPSNSILPGISSDPNYCTAFGGAPDNKGNFWTTFYQTNNAKSLYCFTPDSVWIGYTNPSYLTFANLTQTAVDNYDTKWIVSENSSPTGLYFFNENNTLTNFDDDVSGFYSLSEFPGGSVTNCKDVIVDKNGEVWVATNNGVFIIANPQAAVQNPNNKPPLVKLGIISGNLKVPFTENCTSIQFDILNEKWIGSASNGVFHLSEDGTTLIAQHNTKNSPILDDKINSIVVNNKNGKAYFGTLKGLSALKTNAVEPLTAFDKIICSPNPFVLPSAVNLNIEGLVESSTIKILTLDGQVVIEFDSPGGKIAQWNGLNKSGKNVPTGIYVVAAYTKDGGKVGLGKVAIIRNGE
jgi:ligand-binding sensor domain-containing protein